MALKSWLPIKQDYLIENFENLLQYLSEADYASTSDAFLQETIEKLEEVADSLLSDYFSHRLGVTDIRDEEWECNLRIVAASVIASHLRQRDVSKSFVLMLDTLVVNGILNDEESIDKIRDLVLNLAQGKGVRKLSFGFRDIAGDGFALDVFANKILNTSVFAEGDVKMEFIGNGACLYEQGRIRILPEEPGRDSHQVKFWEDAGLGVSIKAEVMADKDFKDRVRVFNRLMQSMGESGQQHHGRQQKSYSEDDEFYVRITDISQATGWVTCRTLDPEYHPLKLSINLLPFWSPNPYVKVYREDFLRFFEIDDILKVTLETRQGKQYFSLQKTLSGYYFDLYGLNEPDMEWTREAVYKGSFSHGTKWLTAVGKAVNILNNTWDTDIKEAEDDTGSKAIEVNYIESKPDKKGNMVINANRIGSLREVNRVKFEEKIPENMIVDMIDYWKNSSPVFTEPRKESRNIPEYSVRTLCHLLAALGDDLDQPHPERYMDFVAAAMLAIMLGDSHDASFCEFSLAYLRALWAFAQDTGHEWLSSLSAPEELAHLESVIRKSDVAHILSEYKEGGTMQIEMAPVGQEVDVERIQNLVSASNTLVGNISLSEINRIKRVISKCLGIGSIYREKASAKEWFGDEGENLEFKTSIVFPPARKGHESPQPNPDEQIWAILKTINGFLNSVHGGILLIGVNDNGNATGIEKDVEWLSSKHLLFEPTPDRYQQYVKVRADHAFEAYDRSDRDNEISAPRVRYSYFHTDGGVVMQVEVKPYEFGCVRMKGRIDLPGGSQTIRRPDYIREAYIRTAATSEELTENIRKKVRDDKRAAIKDNAQRDRIAVQDAIENSRYLLLKDYDAVSGRRDRMLEPLELLPMRGLVVGKEKGSKDVRVFKLSRCSGVVVTEEEFKPSAEKKTYAVDPFNMLTANDKNTFRLHLRLDRLAWLLLREIYPFAEQYLEEEGDKDTQYPFSLRCDVSDERGVGSFCMSVPGHFKIVDTPRLEAFLKNAASLISGV